MCNSSLIKNFIRYDIIIEVWKFVFWYRPVIALYQKNLRSHCHNSDNSGPCRLHGEIKMWKCTSETQFIDLWCEWLIRQTFRLRKRQPMERMSLRPSASHRLFHRWVCACRSIYQFHLLLFSWFRSLHRDFFWLPLRYWVMIYF